MFEIQYKNIKRNQFFIIFPLPVSLNLCTQQNSNSHRIQHSPVKMEYFPMR